MAGASGKNEDEDDGGYPTISAVGLNSHSLLSGGEPLLIGFWRWNIEDQMWTVLLRTAKLELEELCAIAVLLSWKIEANLVLLELLILCGLQLELDCCWMIDRWLQLS